MAAMTDRWFWVGMAFLIGLTLAAITHILLDRHWKKNHAPTPGGPVDDANHTPHPKTPPMIREKYRVGGCG
jgi:hypothetical protein